MGKMKKWKNEISDWFIGWFVGVCFFLLLGYSWLINWLICLEFTELESW